MMMRRAIAKIALLLIGATGAGAMAGESRISGVVNPEDLAPVPGGQWVLASNMAGGTHASGAIVAIGVKDGKVTHLYPTAAPAGAATFGNCPGEVAANAFAPHGIVLKPGAKGQARLYVVNHGGRESVEVFDLDTKAGPNLRWVGCLPLPANAFANAVAAANDGTVYVTNMGLPPKGPELKLGTDGNVLAWRQGAGWSIVPGSTINGPNGMVVSSDDRRLYVASWTGSGLVRLDVADPKARRDIKMPFLVDNLRWSDSGRILATGHRTPPESVTACYISASDHCDMPSAVAVVDPATLTIGCVRPVSLGLATVAVNVGAETWLGTARGDSVLRLPGGALEGANCEK